MLSTSFSIPCAALSLLAILNGVLSSPIVIDSRAVLPLTVNTIYQFENIGSWVENLAVQKNGQLLVTRVDTPELLQIDPTNKFAPITVATFPSTYSGTLGITETTDGIFYVVAGAPVNGSFIKTSGVASVFQINMNTFKLNSKGIITCNATVHKVADLPNAGFLNGMTTLSDTLLLIADSYLGVVWRVDVCNGESTIIIDDPKMKYLPGAFTNLGINGVKIRDSYLYWSNTGNPIFSRIPINSDGNATGIAEVVAAVNNSDDFVFGPDGTAWMCQNQLESLSTVKNGVTTLVAGNPSSIILAGVTAGEFGRLSTDSHILYLTTNGGLGVPVNGSITTGGKIASIDTSVY